MEPQRKVVTRRRRSPGSERRTFTVRIARGLVESLDELKGELNRSAVFEKLLEAHLRRVEKNAANPKKPKKAT